LGGETPVHLSLRISIQMQKFKKITQSKHMDYELQSLYKPIASLSIHLFIQTGHSPCAFKGEYA